jgi:glycogen operon protein
MAWFRPDGERMTDDDWDSGFAKSVALALDGDEITETDARGEPIDDDSFLLVFNAHHEPLDFRLPDLGAPWRRVLDTAEPEAEPQDAQPGDAVAVGARSVTVFQAPLRER